MSRLLAPLSKAPPRSDEATRRGAPLEIPGEAQLKTKGILTCGSVQGMSMKEHTHALECDVWWQRPCYCGTVCRESTTKPLFVAVIDPSLRGGKGDAFVRPIIHAGVHKKKDLGL